MKESEWIISPKKLKENRERSIERDRQIKERKKELILKCILSVAAIILIILLVKLIVEDNNDFINSCTANGMSYAECARATDGI